MSRIGTEMRATRRRFRTIGPEWAQTRHTFADIVLGEGGGTTPHPWAGDPRPAVPAAAIGDSA